MHAFFNAYFIDDDKNLQRVSKTAFSRPSGSGNGGGGAVMFPHFLEKFDSFFTVIALGLFLTLGKFLKCVLSYYLVEDTHWRKQSPLIILIFILKSPFLVKVDGNKLCLHSKNIFQN